LGLDLSQVISYSVDIQSRNKHNIKEDDMGYKYRVDSPFMVADGPDDFTIEVDEREFDNLGNAKNWAICRPGSKIALVMDNGDEADVTPKSY
jgi:hypothetical protein